MAKINANDLQNQVDQAEELREKHGRVDEAMHNLDCIIALSEQLQWLWVLRNALAQRIVCNKHFFRLRGGETYLHAMLDDCLHGLTLQVTPSQKAVFHFRSAEVYTLSGNLSVAADDYRLALEIVEKDSREHAEILSSQAEFLAGVGKVEDAARAFQKALLIFDQLRGSMPEDHWYTLRAGLYARLAKVAVSQGDLPFGVSCLMHAFRIAFWMLLRWGNRQRLVLLCHELWAELDKRLRRR
ncbi:MAG: hypothetical protein JNK33_03945 [Candidatus Doudnabacteria bacterium]|nr:hypothetical protein [Candidatus Doudnabacteria bacterium]